MSVPVQAAGTSWRQISHPAKSIHSATAPLALASARLAAGPATTPRAGRGATAAAAAAKGAASTSRRDGRSAPASPAMLQTSAARRSILDGVARLTAIRWCAALQRSAVVAIGCTLCTRTSCCLRVAIQVARRCSSGGARTTTRCAGTTRSIERHQPHCAEQLFPHASPRAASRHFRLRRRISRTSFRARCIVPGLRPLSARLRRRRPHGRDTRCAEHQQSIIALPPFKMGNRPTIRERGEFGGGSGAARATWSSGRGGAERHILADDAPRAVLALAPVPRGALVAVAALHGLPVVDGPAAGGLEHGRGLGFACGTGR